METSTRLTNTNTHILMNSMKVTAVSNTNCKERLSFKQTFKSKNRIIIPFCISGFIQKQDYISKQTKHMVNKADLTELKV